MIISLEFSKYQVHVNHYWLFLWNRRANVGFQENVACSVSIEYSTAILSVMDPGLVHFPLMIFQGHLCRPPRLYPFPWCSACFNRIHSLRQVLCSPICVSALPMIVFVGGEGVLNIYWIPLQPTMYQQWPLPGVEAHHRASLRASPWGLLHSELQTSSLRLIIFLSSLSSHHRFLPWNKN